MGLTCKRRSLALIGRSQTTFYLLALLGLIFGNVCATRRGE